MPAFGRRNSTVRIRDFGSLSHRSQTHARQIDAYLCPMRVLDHQGGHPGALTVFQRLHDGVMLTVRVEQVVVHAWQVYFIEGDGMRRRERDSAVALERL